jgi:hypothetical protein
MPGSMTNASCPLADCPSDKDENACADEAGDQVADPTGEGDANEAEQPTRQSCANDAEHYVHQKPHLTFHELLGEPARDTANDDGCNPTDFLIFHGTPLLSVRQAPRAALCLAITETCLSARDIARH